MSSKKLTMAPGLLVSVAASGVFALLAVGVMPRADGGERVPRDNFITGFDQEVSEGLHKVNQESPLGVSIFTDVTDLGSYLWIKQLTVVVGLTLVVASMFPVLRGRQTIEVPVRCALLVVAWILMMAVGEILNMGLKEYIHRARPPYYEAAHASGYSFPSGHSMAAFIAYGMLAYIVIQVIPHRRARWGVVGGLAALVLLIGFSRIFLGAHWLTDVAGGFAAGACWLGLCISAIEIIPGLGPAAARVALSADSIASPVPESPVLSAPAVFPEKTL
jgi:membrane-associated phospholipid phosphatase